MLKPIKRINMRNALIGALAREGVAVTPDAMDKALVWLAEGDPRPDDLPESIVFGGITLAWPRGRETRVPTSAERAVFQAALNHLHTTEDPNERLTDEDNVRVYRLAYEAMVSRLKTDPNMALPALKPADIARAKATVKKEKPPVIEHAVPEDVNVNVLDSILADLHSVTEMLNTLG